MNGVDRVTFVGHDASRTGAPIVLGSFLSWIRRHHPEAEIDLVLRRGGPLVGTYRSLVPTTVLDGPSLRAAARLSDALRSVQSPLSGPARRVERAVLRRRRGSGDAAVVVANTVAALPAAAAIRPGGARLVCHVHELDHVLARVLPGAAAGRRLLSSVDHFVATGEPVARMLVDRLDVPAAEVTVVDAFIERASPTADEVAGARAQLVGADRRPLVLSVGAASHRKGSDRFVDLIAELAADAVHGVWLGAEPGTVVSSELCDDVERMGLGGSLRSHPPVDGTAAAIAAADVVVSTSREDPFPLGLLEAAAAGVPVVAFDSGAFSQLLRAAGCADRVVPQGDTLQMAAAVREVLAGSTATRERTVALQRHVLGAHLTEHVAPELWDVVAP